MQTFFKIVVLFILFSLFSHAQIILDEKDKEFSLLLHSKVYFDRQNQQNIEDLIKKPELFSSYNKEYINEAQDNKYSVWIKFTLYNVTSNTIDKVIGIDGLGVNHLTLFTIEDNKVTDIEYGGFLHREKFSGVLRPYFKVSLPANSEQTYILKIFSPDYTASFKAIINTEKQFLYDDITYHIIWVFVFAVLVTVMMYNILLFIFTKNMIYLSYSLYVLGIIILRDFSYVFWLHLLPLQDTEFVKAFLVKEKAMHVYTTNFIAFTMFFFTQVFLQTKQYPRLNRFLNILIVILILHAVFSSPSFLSIETVSPVYLLFVIFFFFVGFYALYKKNKNAKYFLFGWGVSLTAWLTLLVENLKIYVVKYDFFYYSFQVLVVCEVFLFSYAISRYINELHNKKEKLSKELIVQKENENIILEEKVKDKTEHLNNELETNSILLQELNHRVKNNMQFITSLYDLKLEDTTDPEVKEKLRDIERKVLAISQVHQMLYTQKNLSHIQADNYFEKIVSTIQIGLGEEKVHFTFSAQAELEIEEAIYCGLILNELITNAIKYAFPNNKGEVSISLTEDDNFKYLQVYDNGIGIQNKNNTGFGITLVEGLAIKQLKGNININNTNGTNVKVSFPKS